jgi:hypothetical protein
MGPRLRSWPRSSPPTAQSTNGCYACEPACEHRRPIGGLRAATTGIAICVPRSRLCQDGCTTMLASMFSSTGLRLLHFGGCGAQQRAAGHCRGQPGRAPLTRPAADAAAPRNAQRRTGKRPERRACCRVTQPLHSQHMCAGHCSAGGSSRRPQALATLDARCATAGSSGWSAALYTVRETRGLSAVQRCTRYGRHSASLRARIVWSSIVRCTSWREDLCALSSLPCPASRPIGGLPAGRP